MTLPTPPPDGFDYALVAMPDRTAMQLAADRIRDRLASIRGSFLAIGDELLGVKDRLPHGAFLAWCEAELGIAPRTAQNYMRAADLMRAMPEPARATVSLLPPTTLYRLAGAPREIVAEVVQAAEAGALPPPDALNERIADAAREAREVARVQRTGRTPEDAKKIVATRRKRHAAKREQQHAQEAREAAKREAVRDAYKAVVAHLVATYPDAMIAVAACLDAPGHWHFASDLRDLAAAGLRVTPRGALH